MATVYKRGNAYRVQFVYKGRRRQKQFKKLREANAFAAKADLGAPPDLSNMTFEVAARAWLAACQVGRDGHPPLERATLELYRGYVENWILPEIGKIRLGRVTPSVIRKFRDDIVKEDAALARSTVKKIVGSLKSVLAHAVLTGDLVSNPGAGITVRMSRRRDKVIEVPSVEVVTDLLDLARKLAVHDNGTIRNAWIRYYPFVRILATTGLRLSEVRGLPRAAWKKDDLSLRVFQRADKFGHIGPVKSKAAQRTVFVDKETGELLERQLAAHGFELIFASKTGAALDAHNVAKRMWLPLLEMLDLKGTMTIHHLRHFYASRLIALGESVKEVSAALGHEDEAFTLRVYGHLFQDRESVERRKRRADLLLASPPTDC